MHPSRTFLSFLLLFSCLIGCTPTCEQVCDKLVACEDMGTERMSSRECEEQCLSQKAVYAAWTDDQVVDNFEAELDCLYTSECADITAGSCYEESVFSF